MLQVKNVNQKQGGIFYKQKYYAANTTSQDSYRFHSIFAWHWHQFIVVVDKFTNRIATIIIGRDADNAETWTDRVCGGSSEDRYMGLWNTLVNLVGVSRVRTVQILDISGLRTQDLIVMISQFGNFTAFSSAVFYTSTLQRLKSTTTPPP